MRRICIITGTRAEWGLLSGLAAKLRDAKDVHLQIIATNMHLSPKFGHTVDEITKSGFVVDAEVPMVDDAAPSNAEESVKAMGREMLGFATAFSELRPDMAVILGDRYEMLVAASAALIFGIPIAHLHGGEVTEGAFDDAIRHAITKMSALHFVSTDEYRQRVIQMGEDPSRVFYVGAIGCENIRQVPLMSRAEVESSLGFELTDKFFLITYHPVTIGADNGAKQITELLSALDEFPDYKLLITHPNSDKGGDVIRTGLESYAAKNPRRVKLVASLGMRRYLSCIPLANAVIGNSSSGLLEVPSFKVPTVNIGSRQNGRVRAKSVIDCDTGKVGIVAAIRQAIGEPFKSACASVVNPYDKSGTIDAIVQELTRVDLKSLIGKRFYDFPGGGDHV